VIDGIGIANDAAHVLQPDKNGTGARIAIQKAMKQADTQPRDYKVFNAHATSTPTGDPIEYDVLKDIFLGGFLYSNKGQLGHMMGASGLTELVLGAEAMRRGFIPGNAGLTTPFTDDKYFTLKEKTVTGEYHRFMKTSFGFGGRAAAVSVRKA
jgi:3-oxoacyl-[acyl-carrier-protein] synthase II